MEKKILLVSANERLSNKNGNWYSIIEYVDKENNQCKSLVKAREDMDQKLYRKVKERIKEHDVTEVTGIFTINRYDRAELADIK